MKRARIWTRLFTSICFVSVQASLAAAQSSPAAAPSDTASHYHLPPQSILDVMQAPLPPRPYASPTRDTVLLVSREYYPSIARVSTPFQRLAGVRIETKNHSRHDTRGGYGITPCDQSLDLVRVADATLTHVTLPANSCAGTPVWSADGKQFAFINIAPEAVELWVGDMVTASAHKIPGVRVNPALYDEVQWMPDQKTILVKLVPDGLGAPPPDPILPSGPSIQETGGESGKSSTYEVRDTLNNEHDVELFDYYIASQLALVDPSTGKIQTLGKAANYETVKPAPDGRHVLTVALHKPYSYETTYERFPKQVEVWDISDPAQPSAHAIASLPAADRVPIEGVPVGPREFSWRATDPDTLMWTEALDGGDWNVTVPYRDKVMMLRAPFDAPPVEIARLEQRYDSIAWGERPDIALLTEVDFNRHWTKTHILNVDDPKQKPRLLWDLSMDEHYKDPGSPVMRQLANGVSVLRMDGDSMFTSGDGSSPDGDRPFLDRLHLDTLKSERLFRSDESSLEYFVCFSGPGFAKIVTWRQSHQDPPNLFARTIGDPVNVPAGEAAFSTNVVPITHLVDPTPVVRQIQKRLVKYKRADGLDLSFTLYTPPGYQEGQRVPTILYAYPLDYADASVAGQVTGSQEQFTRLYQYSLLLLAGYAIIDDASFPIVGDPKKAYDTYLEQLVADAKAAVDEAVRLGVTDPNRVGVTGHSHGALMTVNLVAHSDLFRAGAATSGSYNKTLTPFGFQNERRSVWEAPDIYLKVSPFFVADKLKTPLLIVHGAEDANPGTTPLQATKLFEAIRGNGGTARLVMLPHEPHWYAALESNEELIYEMLAWFDKYVKDAPARSSVSKH
jgi:dipeptidyl aminopeptidase/acylaminoacyl peptidase